MENMNLSTPSMDAQKVIGQISAMAMVDEEFKSRLAADPRPVLAENGVDLPDGMRVEIVSAAEEIPADRDPSALYLIIPVMDDLSDRACEIPARPVPCARASATRFHTQNFTLRQLW